jgi:serine/threonine-protein kinase RsbW
MKTELCVPSDLRFLNIVETWLLSSLELEVGDQVDWMRQASRLRLVLVEAYSNVVRHAHRDQPNLPILIRLELKDRDLALEIWDQGGGFNLETYRPPVPTAAQEGGYGWLILHRLMDKVEYQLHVNGLNCLKLETTLSELGEGEDDIAGVSSSRIVDSQLVDSQLVDSQLVDSQNVVQA